MRIPLLLFILQGFSTHIYAQETIPFDFTSDEDNRLIKENDSVKYYAASGDTTNIACINEEASVYWLLNKEHKLLAMGSFVTEGDKLLQDGKWVAKYENGKLKLTGYYQQGLPVGTWQEFYDNGKAKMISNYAVIKDDRGKISSCLSGTFEEFHNNGKLKTEGFYAAVLTTATDSVEVEDPVTNVKVYSIDKSTTYKPEKTGHWENYDENGIPEKGE